MIEAGREFKQKNAARRKKLTAADAPGRESAGRKLGTGFPINRRVRVRRESIAALPMIDPML